MLYSDALMFICGELNRDLGKAPMLRGEKKASHKPSKVRSCDDYLIYIYNQI